MFHTRKSTQRMHEQMRIGRQRLGMDEWPIMIHPRRIDGRLECDQVSVYVGSLYIGAVFATAEDFSGDLARLVTAAYSWQRVLVEQQQRAARLNAAILS